MPQGSQVGNAQANAQTFASQEPAQVQQAQQQLTQQAGIPQLQNQQADLGKIFQMYLSDQNLSQKYSDSSLSTPNSPLYNNPSLTAQPIQGLFSGYQSQVKNPYLASPESIINAVTQPAGQGFQGFTTPGGVTASMGAAPGAAQSVISTLQGLIDTQKSLVSQKTGDYTTAYETQAGLLNTLAQLAGQNAQSQASAKASGVGGFAQGSTGEAGNLFNTIVDSVQSAKGGAATEQDVWDYINQHATALADQGVNVKELWKLQKDMATKVGWKGLISGGSKTPKVAAQSAQVKKQQATDAMNKLNAMKAAYEKYTKTHNPSDLQAYKAQRIAFADAYAYSLNKSRADASVKRVISQLPDPDFSTQMGFLERINNLFGGEGGFAGTAAAISADGGLDTSSGSSSSSGNGSAGGYKIIQVK
jgi:hypothetical protein